MGVTIYNTKCPACGSKDGLTMTVVSDPFKATGVCWECGFTVDTVYGRMTLQELNKELERLDETPLAKLPEISEEFAINTVESLIKEFKNRWGKLTDDDINNYEGVVDSKGLSFDEKKQIVLEHEVDRFVGSLDVDSQLKLALKFNTESKHGGSWSECSWNATTREYAVRCLIEFIEGA